MKSIVKTLKNMSVGSSIILLNSKQDGHINKLFFYQHKLKVTKTTRDMFEVKALYSADEEKCPQDSKCLCHFHSTYTIEREIESWFEFPPYLIPSASIPSELTAL